MGIYDREYMSDSGRKGIAAWSVVTWLLIVNTVVFIFQHAIFNYEEATQFLRASRDTVFKGQIWRLLTCQFAHGYPLHLIFNMLMLFFMGRFAERVFGSKNLLWLYLIGGVLGAILHVSLSPTGVVGASASVFAIVIALVCVEPNRPISLLFLPFQFKLKYVGYVLLGMSIVGALLNMGASPEEGIKRDNVSHLGHLGGILGGWLFVKMILPSLRRGEIRTENRKAARKKKSKLKEAQKNREAEERKTKEVLYLSEQVDAILEKISESGMHSLTDEEKKILEKSSEKLSKKLGDK